jgi:drug/metabolite transporter (DMT)-like permease
VFNISQIAFLIGTLVCLSAGQVLFKIAALQMDDLQSLFQRWILNYHLWAALALYAIGTLFWVSTLRQVPLRLAYPAIALSYLIVPFLSHYLLDEEISARTIAGALIIVLGVFISMYEL